MFSLIPKRLGQTETDNEPVIIEGTTDAWNNAYEVQQIDKKPVPHGRWIWFYSPIQSNNFGVEPPFDGMISTKFDVPFANQFSTAILKLNLYDPDGIIKYARAIVNDKIIINMGDWKLKKDTIGEINNLQKGTNFVIIEFKMKKKYPFTKILLGTLKQPAVSATIQAFPKNPL